MNTYQNQELARLDILIGNFLVAPLNSIQTKTTQIVLQSPPLNPKKRGRSGGNRTRRIHESKKRHPHTKRKKHIKKRVSKKLKKKNRKKRTTKRKKNNNKV